MMARKLSVLEQRVVPMIVGLRSFSETNAGRVADLVGRAAGQVTGTMELTPTQAASLMFDGLMSLRVANTRLRTMEVMAGHGKSGAAAIAGRLESAMNTAVNATALMAGAVQAASSALSGGLGIVPALLLVQGYVVYRLYQAIMNVKTVTEEAQERCAAEQRVTGQPCDFHQVLEQVKQERRDSSLLSVFERTADKVLDAAAGPADKVAGGYSTVIKVVGITAGVAALGALAYVAWPWLAGARRAGTAVAGRR
jgi:hypothetical protein